MRKISIKYITYNRIKILKWFVSCNSLASFMFIFNRPKDLILTLSQDKDEVI